MKKRHIFVSLVTLLSVAALATVLGQTPNWATAAPLAAVLQQTGGGLDPTFGAAGKVATSPGAFDRVAAIVIQADGKLVVAGSSDVNQSSDAADFALARYNPDGSLDPTFGNGGVVLTDFGGNDQAAALALQADGKLVAAGSSDANGTTEIAVARYNTNGGLDPTLGGTGKITTNFGGDYDSVARTVVIQADGKLVVAGDTCPLSACEFDFALVRYLADGNLDGTFGIGGKVTTDFGGSLDGAYALALQPDGKLVAAGRDDEQFALARYTPDGNLDASFGNGGGVTTDFNPNFDDIARSLAVQPDGKLVVAGQVTDQGNFAVVRYTAAGALDPTFGIAGRVQKDFGGDDRAAALAVQSDGKLVLAGASNVLGSGDFALASVGADGNLDAAFANNGATTTDFFGANDSSAALALQPDGKLVAAGVTHHATFDDFALARYLGVPVTVPTSTPVPATPTPPSATIYRLYFPLMGR